MKTSATREDRQSILNCTHTNAMYMAASAPGGRPPTPAVEAGYPAVVEVYRRIARESSRLANQWVQEADLEAAEGDRYPGAPVPPHSPDVDAFWWTIVFWAQEFCSEMVAWWDSRPELEEGVVRQRERKNDNVADELVQRFIMPHWEFAYWLRPMEKPPFSNAVGLWRSWPDREDTPGPARIILDQDADWTMQVLKWTARWGIRPLTPINFPALWQALLLVRKLRQHDNAVARAYLESDLDFLEELFCHFPLGRRATTMIDVFLQVAREEARHPTLR